MTNDSKRYFDDHGQLIGAESSTNKTWADVRPETDENFAINIESEEEKQGLFFSSSKRVEKCVKYKNFVKANEPTPIINEVICEENVDISKITQEKRKLNEHAAIPPPPTMDYYGPASKQSKSDVPFKSDLHEAYAQGVKLLQPKHQKMKISKDYDFMF